MAIKNFNNKLKRTIQSLFKGHLINWERDNNNEVMVTFRVPDGFEEITPKSVTVIKKPDVNPDPVVLSQDRVDTVKKIKQEFGIEDIPKGEPTEEERKLWKSTGIWKGVLKTAIEDAVGPDSLPKTKLKGACICSSAHLFESGCKCGAIVKERSERNA